MALAVTGRRQEADAAYQWLGSHPAARRILAPVLQPPTASTRTSSTPTRSPTSPRACGINGCASATPVSCPRCGRWRSGPSTSFSVCRHPGARSCGPATPTARRGPSPCSTGSASISHSLRCGLAIAHAVGQERPSWELALARLVHTIRHFGHEAFAPKDRFAMDWYYPVLTGVLTGSEARARMALRRRVFVHEGEGVLCVSNQDWVTTAETCECAMAYLATGDRAAAIALFEWAQRQREPDGGYLTGRAFPANVSYPHEECTTYSAAAVAAGRRRPGRHQPGLRPLRRLRLAARAARSRSPGGARPRLVGGSGAMWHERRLLIDGELVEAADGVTFPTVNPSTEEVLGTAGRRRAGGCRGCGGRGPAGLRLHRLVPGQRL